MPRKTHTPLDHKKAQTQLARQEAEMRNLEKELHGEGVDPLVIEPEPDPKARRRERLRQTQLHKRRRAQAPGVTQQ